MDKAEFIRELSGHYEDLTVFDLEPNGWTFSIEDLRKTRRNLIRLSSAWAEQALVQEAVGLLRSLPPCEAKVTRDGLLFTDDRDFRPADEAQLEVWKEWCYLWMKAIAVKQQELDEVERLLQRTPSEPVLQASKCRLEATITAYRVPLASAAERIRRQS